MIKAPVFLLLLLLGCWTHASPVEFYVDSLQQPTLASGVWRFKAGDDLAWADPALDHFHWDNILVPRDWRRQGHDEYTGMAWYRATFELDLARPEVLSELDQLGISMGKVHSAYELYVNGVLLGGVGRVPPEPVMVHDQMRIYSIPRSLVQDNGLLTVAVRVWRDPVLGGSSTAGLYEEPVRLGRVLDLTKAVWFPEVRTLMLDIIYLTFGLYHLYLYTRNRRLPEFLWFGLATILVAIYSLEVSQWRFIADSLPYLLHKKIEYFTVYLLPAIGLQLVWSLLHYSPSRWHRAYQFGFIGFASLVVLVPGHNIHAITLFSWQMYLLPGLLALLVHVLWEALHGNREARTMLVGWAIFVCAVISDIMVAQGVVQHPRFLTLGFSAVLLTMGLSLANRFSRLYNNLENEVRLRTRELRESNAKLVEAAHIDTLTGLRNRRGFADAVDVEIARAGRTRRGFVLLMADVDHFKIFNDQHGHACGDYMLREAARLLQEQLRELDVMARWGGEEFIFLLPETSLEGGAVLAEKLRAVLEAERFDYRDNIILSLTITIGVAQFEEGRDLDDCLARADRALYQGKQAGRNRVVVDTTPATTQTQPDSPAPA
jgi:diguanylate cyclase (GGDEF)-like protein